MKRHILITGGCGRIGSYVARFAADQYAVRIVDKVAWDATTHGPLPGEAQVADLQNLEACRTACAGMDAVIHLAADPSPEADFMGSLLANNLLATYNMFRAAQEAGCKRFIFASSVHAVGAYPADVQVKATMPVRPGNLYGVSKCFGEALAAYFAFSAGLPSIVVRIGGYYFPEMYKGNLAENAGVFLNPDDFNELLLRCLETPDITFAIAHAISNNRFKRLDLTETRDLLGYQPQADAFSILGFPATRDEAL